MSYVIITILVVLNIILYILVRKMRSLIKMQDELIQKMLKNKIDDCFKQLDKLGGI